MERLTYRGSERMTEDGLIRQSYSDYPTRRIIERLAEYEDLDEQGLLLGLEELKAIKEMDLSIPQHFTKEQSNWIKAYCIKRNIEFYNKAIEDFKKELFKNSERARPVGWLGYREIVTCEKIYDIAEQLKAGVENERSI